MDNFSTIFSHVWCRSSLIAMKGQRLIFLLPLEKKSYKLSYDTYLDTMKANELFIRKCGDFTLRYRSEVCYLKPIQVCYLKQIL